MKYAITYGFENKIGDTIIDELAEKCEEFGLCL